MKRVFALALVLVCGCMSNEIVVQATKPYEGHYMTVEDFKNGTSSSTLEKGESIWVLSNTTLKRLLKNTGK